MRHLKTTAVVVSPQTVPRASRGFSLIELLIVVAIILIIASIAIPNLMRARMAANETAAVANLRTISTANVIYSTQWGIGYAAQLADMGGTGAFSPTAAQLIDVILASSAKNGYTFTYVSAPPSLAGIVDSYTVNVAPLNPGTTGQRYFFMSESGIIRANPSAPASVSDTPIQ